MAKISAKSQSQLQVDDGYLLALAKQGSPDAYDRLVRRYYSFVRLKASSYFLIGGDSEDLIQEGLVGLYKAIRDYRTDRESSFRNFAELCITRQIITAVKTATRNKHTPLNGYVSFSSSPAGAMDSEPTLDEMLAGPTVHDPVNQVISSEELRSLVACLSTVLSELESMDPENERFDAKVTVLMENVRNHVEEEEEEYFPKVRDELGRNALNDLGEAMEAAKKVAPTHPHPTAPDTPPGNLIMGTAAGVWVYTRPEPVVAVVVG